MVEIVDFLAKFSIVNQDFTAAIRQTILNSVNRNPRAKARYDTRILGDGDTIRNQNHRHAV